MSTKPVRAVVVASAAGSVMNEVLKNTGRLSLK